MRKIITLLFFLVTIPFKSVFAQGADCSTASPFCTAAGTATFPASQNTTAPLGPDYDCLGTQPNPAWYYLQMATAGNITLDMSNSANLDIDFAIWGPFTSPTSACASGLTSPPVDCSYSISANETGTITGANVGEVYVLLITNYSNQPTTISLTQNGASTGATNCNIVCLMDSITTTQGACESPANTFSMNGTVFYTSPPTSGTLTVSNSCNSVSQVFNFPFHPDSVSYTLDGLLANGNTCTITAEFSADPTCTVTKTFTAPPPCFVDCPIVVDSAHTCDGVPATLTVSGATDGYIWSTGETSTSILASGVPAVYTVIGFTGTCADTATAVVTTFSKPTIGITADTLLGCGQLTVAFEADTVGNMNAIYTWQFGANDTTATGINTAYHYSEPGCYTVTLTASLGQGCTTTDSVSCMINVLELPQAEFSFSPNDINSIASTAYFSDLSTNATQWLWNFGDTTFSTVQHPEHTYLEVGTYPVTLYISNDDGCIDSVTYELDVKDIVTFYAPNAFTPNKNDKNEEFFLYTYGVLDQDYEMLIFDRWGKQVFKTTDKTVGWNGSFNNSGKVLSSDTYVYKVNYREATGKYKSVIGHINLIR